MTLYLPYNLPRSQVVCSYAFDHNETHAGLGIDYGSLLNHHESANVKHVSISGSDPNVVFQVRRVSHLSFMNGNVLKINIHVFMHMHKRCTEGLMR